MKTTRTGTAVALCLCCCAAAALIARPTVALPIAEEGVEDADIAKIQTTTVGETIQTTGELEVTSPQGIIEPEVTSPQDIVEPEVTSPQGIIEPEVTSPQDIVEPELTSPQSTVQPEATSPQITVEPEVTSPQSTAGPEVPSTTYTGVAEEILDVTSEPTTEAIEEAATTLAPTRKITTLNSTNAEIIKDKLSEQIRKILRHYQQPDPVGFPGAPIPDPLALPDMEKSLGFVTMNLQNITVHGLSKFEVDQISADLQNMTVYVVLRMKRLYVLGDYTLVKLFGKPDTGPFNATLLDVEAAGTATLRPDESGRLQAADTEADMRFDACALDFGNMSPLYRDTVSSFGPALFELIKPFVTGRVNEHLRADVNAQLRQLTGRLPALRVPVPDLAVAEARAYVRRAGYDPLRVADRRVRGGPLDVSVANMTVTGLSRFRRVGDIGLEVRGPALRVAAHVATGPVNGTLDWSYRLSGLGRSGRCNVSVDHVQVRAVVNQTLDVRRRPVLDRLDIEVGRVTVLTDRREPVDFMVEAALNSLPALVRHVLVDALEGPIKVRAQAVLDEVRVDQLIEERLPDLDRLLGE